MTEPHFYLHKNVNLYLQVIDSHLGDFAFQGHLLTLGDWLPQWGKAVLLASVLRDTAEHLKKHRIALHNKELPGPKCQIC